MEHTSRTKGPALRLATLGAVTAGALGCVACAWGCLRASAGAGSTGAERRDWPSGAVLAASIQVEDTLELWLVPVDGGEPSRLLEPPPRAWDGWPTWNPYGDRLAFVRDTEGPGARTEVLTCGPGGVDCRVLARATSAVEGLSWSPDGAHLVVGAPYPPGLRVLSADGASERQLTDRVDMAPAWSPDGSTIVFTRLALDAEDGSDGLWACRADGTAARRLVGSVAGVGAAWPPDSGRIAFALAEAGQSDICTVQADGGGLTYVTRTPGLREGAPAWSPDGTRIAFWREEAPAIPPGSVGRDRVSHRGDVYVSRVDGSECRRLTYLRAPVQALAWRPALTIDQTEGDEAG